jgi:hypothetical protein
MARALVLFAAAIALGCGKSEGTLVTLAGSTSPDASAAHASPTPWQIQLTGTLDTSFDVDLYEVDLFDTAPSAIAGLHQQGRRVTCYVSVGTDEPWRPDSASFASAALGNPLAHNSRERWLDDRDPIVRSTNAARLALAAQNGCDAVELSNLQAHSQDSGFPLTVADELDYAHFLIDAAHAGNLSVGASPSDDLLPALAPDLDWGLTEECLAYKDCEAWQVLVGASKPVFMIEYGSTQDAPVLCPQAATLGFSLVIKRSTLDAFRVGCEAISGQ